MSPTEDDADDMVFGYHCIYSFITEEILSHPDKGPSSYGFEEAWNHPTDFISWRDSIRDEFGSMLDNRVWEVVEWDEKIPASDIIDSKWVFKHKLNVDGTIAR